MKTIICSDVHGRPELLENVIKHSGYVKGQDRLIFAGDLVDIGHDPISCLEVLERHNTELLWGNHDLARYMGNPIWPQSSYDPEVYDAIYRNSHDFQIATIVGEDILVTHAGLGERFYNIYFKPYDDIEYVCDVLNAMSLRDFWNDYSPIWYRPNNYDRLVTYFEQICGHTPPTPENGLMAIGVDPYTRTGFESKDRFRYALVENSTISIIDSNYDQKL